MAVDNIFKRVWKAITITSEAPMMKPQARLNEGTGHYTLIGGINFTGEKNIGELGPVKNYVLSYAVLRARSWQMYLESEIVQTIIRKFTTWVVGVGLKLQAEPVADVIKDESGKTIDPQEFSKKVEQRWSLYANSKHASHDKQKTLNQIAKQAVKNALVAGDCLVIIRLEDNYCPTIQLVDADNIVSPLHGTESFPAELKNGHNIVNGIELNEKREHVAYYVRRDGLAFRTDRVPAKGGESGLTIAFMLYGDQYKIDNYRGMPLLSSVFETSKKLERYKEATVGGAEERAKIAIAIEHESYSTGENPFARETAIARNTAEDANRMPEDDNGVQLQNRVIATTNKESVNLPPGAKLHAMESKQELYFKDFYTVNSDSISSSVEMPPNVAMSKYDQNFSASRAALKDWENTLRVRRADIGIDFYQPIYIFWLEVQVLLNKIQAPGYIKGRLDENWMLLEAYRKTRYVGTPVPHIDPVKEVEAERKKLGIAADHIPLTTVEAATEAISGGDSDSNMEQFELEIKKAEAYKPEVPQSKPGKPA